MRGYVCVLSKKNSSSFLQFAEYFPRHFHNPFDILMTSTLQPEIFSGRAIETLGEANRFWFEQGLRYYLAELTHAYHL